MSHQPRWGCHQLHQFRGFRLESQFLHVLKAGRRKRSQDRRRDNTIPTKAMSVRSELVVDVPIVLAQSPIRLQCTKSREGECSLAQTARWEGCLEQRLERLVVRLAEQPPKPRTLLTIFLDIICDLEHTKTPKVRRAGQRDPPAGVVRHLAASRSTFDLPGPTLPWEVARAAWTFFVVTKEPLRPIHTAQVYPNLLIQSIRN